MAFYRFLGDAQLFGDLPACKRALPAKFKYLAGAGLKIADLPLNECLKIVIPCQVVGGLVIGLSEKGKKGINVPGGHLLMGDGVDDAIADSCVQVNGKTPGDRQPGMIGPEPKEQLMHDILGFLTVFQTVIGKYIQKAMITVVYLRISFPVAFLQQRDQYFVRVRGIFSHLVFLRANVANLEE